MSTPKSLLAVDIGNTSIAFGLFKKGKIVKRESILTREAAPAKIARLAIVRRALGTPALISSVVPGVSVRVKKSLKSALKAPVQILGEDLKVPIANRARIPSQVGIDRLVNALEAYRRFKTACIAVDFGTAITFDVVSKRGEYLGGVIAPGIELTLNALFEKTALLPKIRLKHPDHVLGRDTESCIRSGCSFGLGALCDGILQKLMKERGIKPQHIIATGGYAGFVSRYTKLIRRIDEDLILKGIHSVAL